MQKTRTSKTQSDILTLAQKLILVSSISGDNEKALEILELVKNELEGFEYTTYVSEGIPSLLYSNQKNAKKFKIILNAHLDVVPGKPALFVPIQKDGKLHGRGAYDMKAAAAVMILLFKEMAHKLPYPIGLQLVTDEELAGSVGTRYQIEQGIACDFAIIGECGSNLAIVNENKGLMEIEITTKGQAAHSAYPWMGDNAIMHMHEILEKIQQAFPTPNEATHETTVNVSTIKTSNKTWNKVPENCTVSLDVRFPKDQKDKILAEIKKLIPADVSVKVLRSRSHYYTPQENSFVKHLQKAGKSVVNEMLPVKKTYAGSDCVFFANAGLNAVEFGPVGHGQHHDDEYVILKSLEDYYTILKKFLTNLAL